MTELATSPQGTQTGVRWKWFLALGVLLLLLGLAGGGATALLGFTSQVVFGPLLLASSLFQLLTAFFAEKGKEKLLHFIAAGLEAVLGFLIIAHPLDRVVSLIVLVAIFLVLSWLVRLARSLVAQPSARGWTAMAGLIAILLGICAWSGWPVGKGLLLALCIAVDFICHGVSWSVLALEERKPLPPAAS